MGFIKKFFLYLTTPFNRFGSRGITDAITKTVNKHKYLNYIIAFVITAIVVLAIIFL